MFHYLEGGSDDEWTLLHNTAAFDALGFVPEVLRDVSRIDLGTSILGSRLSMPLMLSPTGMSRLFHHGKEFAAARAAARAGTMYSLSTMATSGLEEIAAAAAGPKMFQIYIFKDRGLTRELVQRCKAANYQALCLTVDTPVAGNRERDRVSGMTLPPRLSMKSLLSFGASPSWVFNFLRDSDFRLANVMHRVDALAGGAMGVIEYVNSQFDRSVTWEDAAWLAAEWNGPFVIKGISSVGDARRAVSIGASALMISNHGGRQLDGCIPAIECLPPIRDALGSTPELILDGGVRRGTHVLKALALGANACSIGRPYLYGLAAGGEAGVSRALELLRNELELSMALLGCTRLSDIRPDHLRPVGALPAVHGRDRAVDADGLADKSYFSAVQTPALPVERFGDSSHRRQS
mgnify:CR=1 FL=1